MSKRMIKLFAQWLRKCKSAHLTYAHTYIGTLLFDMHVCVPNFKMTFQDAYFHTLQADDRTKAALFVERYDKAIADPATKLKVHRVSHYSASGALGLDLRAYASSSPMFKKLRTEITAYQLCMLDDSMQESPHARISRVVQAARPSKPPWWSATVRLRQNLAIGKSLDELKPQHSRALFQAWKFLTHRPSQPQLARTVESDSQEGRCQAVLADGIPPGTGKQN